jgi:hypothetical protein
VSRRHVVLPVQAVIVIVLVIVLVFLLTVYELGGFAAEPAYATWCDQGTNGNRIYESHNGAIAVVPADKTC